MWKLCLTALLLTAGAGGFCAWVFRPETVPRKPTRSGVLRVVSYNTLWDTPAAKTAAMLGELDADVILLQEVNRNTRWSGPEDQPELLKEALQMHGYYAVSYNMQGGTTGQMILSRYPIRDGRVIDLPNSRNLGAAATIDVNGRAIRVYSIHLSSTYRLSPGHVWKSCTARQREANRIAGLVDRDLAASLPTIGGGDLNTLPHTGPYKVFASRLTDCASAVGHAGATLPRKLPILRYDFVFVSGHFIPLTAGTRPGASDHLAIVSDVNLSEAAP